MSNFYQELPIFETQRLIMRPLVESDFEHMRKLETEESVVKYLGNGEIRTEEETRYYLNKHLNDYRKYGLGLYAVEEKESNIFIGRSGLIPWVLDKVNKPLWEIGYTLRKESWGKGYATELASHLKSWAESNLDTDFVVSLIHPENKASINVAKKIGMDFWKKIKINNYECDGYRIKFHKG